MTSLRSFGVQAKEAIVSCTTQGIGCRQSILPEFTALCGDPCDTEVAVADDLVAFIEGSVGSSRADISAYICRKDRGGKAGLEVIAVATIPRCELRSTPYNTISTLSTVDSIESVVEERGKFLGGLRDDLPVGAYV